MTIIYEPATFFLLGMSLQVFQWLLSWVLYIQSTCTPIGWDLLGYLWNAWAKSNFLLWLLCLTFRVKGACSCWCQICNAGFVVKISCLCQVKQVPRPLFIKFADRSLMGAFFPVPQHKICVLMDSGVRTHNPSFGPSPHKSGRSHGLGLGSVTD